MIAMTVATMIHIPLCLLFVNGFGFGVQGLAIATSIKEGLLLLSIMTWVDYSP